uniref:Aminotransferase-like plant mobile domain-containing protein n=1 Tax=Triticum urartu TaxID=4572 RepID=A0A8R7QJX4_TRIUA
MQVYKPIRFIEHGTRLNQWEVKHEGMLAILQRAGFYHLCFLKRVQLDHALLNALVERWRRETQTFHLRFGEMAVLLKDVAILTGLRVDGTPVTGATGCHWEQLCLELLGQEPPQIKGGSINIAWLYDTFSNLPERANQSEIEHATRAYIMYQIGCSLFPDPSGTRVHLRYLALLRDFDASGEMAWGAAVLAHLYRELGKASMKGKANCCAFLTLLQIWAWEHIQIGRPERLENKSLNGDQPLGCRWDVPFKNRENVRSIDQEFYRHGLDTITDCQITWDPYKPSLIDGLPALCTLGSAVWQSRTPLICFQIVEMHVPDRVLLQFGMMQHIPDPVEAVERVTMQGKTDEDWSTYHEKYIKQWDNRLHSVAGLHNAVNSDPTHARNCYLEWYWQITRRWISTPVECPFISYQLSGHSEKALVDLVSTVQGRIRALLSGEIDGERVKESLNDIDMYITSEMEKSQFATTACADETGCLNYTNQHMVLPSTPLQVMQIVVPTEMRNGSVESATTCSASVDFAQATVTKLEQVTGDCMERNSMLQLDQTREIQPAGGTAVGPCPTRDDTSNWSEDVHHHQKEDPLSASTTEVNLRDIMSTPVEDAVTEIMNTSPKDVTLEETSDAEMKNGEGHPLTSYVLIETVDAQEDVEPMDNNRIRKKVDHEPQECVHAPVINSADEEIVRAFRKDNCMDATHVDPDSVAGQETVSKSSDGPESYKILGVSSHDDQLQKVTSASGKDDIVDDVVGMRTGNSTGQGAIGGPFNATGLGENLNASEDKPSSMQEDAGPPSGSEQEEPAAAAAVPGCGEDHVVDAAQNLILQADVDDQIGNNALGPAVLHKSAVHITSVGENRSSSFTVEATDTLEKETSTGDGYPDEYKLSSKRRKVAASWHENADAPDTKIEGNAKTDEQTCQYVRTGSAQAQMIAFTRRKTNKAEVMQSSP